MLRRPSAACSAARPGGLAMLPPGESLQLAIDLAFEQVERG